MSALKRIACSLLVLLIATLSSRSQNRSKLATDKGATLIAAATGAVELASARVSIPLKAAGPGGNRRLADRIRSLQAGQRIYLRIADLTTNEAPGVLYGIYLDLPPGASLEPHNRYFVGYLNFFDVQGSNRHSFRSFDVTDLLEKLQDQEALASTTTVTISPQQPPAQGSKPLIGRIELLLS
jgi:hypothetical protein